MAKTTSRICKECGQRILIFKEDVQDVVYYKKNYYHTPCFRKLAEQRLNNKQSKSGMWKDALENIDALEQCARDIINTPIRREAVARDTDPLNEYLRSYYNVDRIASSNFWKTVKELQNGIYKQKKCQKVSLDILLEAWKWAQPRLDKINRSNKMRNKGPKDNKERIPYDLAILVGHISDYLAYKAKQDAIMVAAAKENIYAHVNYDDMIRTDNIEQEEGLGDISYLLDDDDDD